MYTEVNGTFYEFTNAAYNLMHSEYKRGIITKQEWIDYCFLWEEYLMKMHQKILYDLKNIAE